MKLNIYEYLNSDNITEYYIAFSEYQADSEVAERIQMAYTKYRNILLEHNAHSVGTAKINYNFHNREDAELAILILDPHVIMASLTEE